MRKKDKCKVLHNGNANMNNKIVVNGMNEGREKRERECDDK